MEAKLLERINLNRAAIYKTAVNSGKIRIIA